MTSGVGPVWRVAERSASGLIAADEPTATRAPMVDVPAGSFLRGSELSPDEQPVLSIRMSAYAIDVDPVRNRDFARFLVADGYQTPALWTPEGWDYVRSRGLTEPTYWRDPVWGDPEMPVTGVSWWEALAYARFVAKALPSEAQWEYAARGSDGRTYPWGEEEPTPELANFAPDCDPVNRAPTRPDAHLAAVSPFGCRDMAGNFAEWCLDSYAPGYHGGRTADPLVVGDDPFDERVVRGGCGLHDEDYLRCAARDHYPPGLRDNLIGFRCVRVRPRGTL